MAATAGGVAVGSAVGHVVGAGVTSLFSGNTKYFTWSSSSLLRVFPKAVLQILRQS